jgi:hypothetical protein
VLRSTKEPPHAQGPDDDHRRGRPGARRIRWHERVRPAGNLVTDATHTTGGTAEISKVDALTIKKTPS